MSQSARRILGGRYQLVDRVGRGGMGAVWRARDQLLGREVAVKQVLLPQGLDDEELAAVRGRALREARAAAKVRHPAVVTIYDVVIEDDQPWIVMEFIRERSLADRLDAEKRLPVPEVARIGAALVGALTAIHRQGILHRDVKPGNVLMEEGGQVVLTDFGLATIEGDPRLTASNLLIGTPGYMAPERLAGEPVGPASDLWSLGAVLYTAAEGRSPYEGRTPVVVASAVLTGDPRPARVSGRLAPVISALLARDPAERMDAPTAAKRLAELAAGAAGAVGESTGGARGGTGGPAGGPVPRPVPGPAEPAWAGESAGAGVAPASGGKAPVAPAGAAPVPHPTPDLVAPGGVPPAATADAAAPLPDIAADSARAAPGSPATPGSAPAASVSPGPETPRSAAPTGPGSPGPGSPGPGSARGSAGPGSAAPGPAGPVAARSGPPAPPPVDAARTETFEPVGGWDAYQPRSRANTPLARLMFYGGAVLIALAVLAALVAALT